MVILFSSIIWLSVFSGDLVRSGYEVGVDYSCNKLQN